ncbi:response regulator transcription factor [Puniceicoccus vermicola]|uniref:Response regulator n=1 Tax=Puniceicoccus vermicola TaxID=388746 RepID=A0A7X1AWX7_9BACT|nr:response regulator [Puniceicoccus vermicola]MBC2600553.1 response regulator [Puniceicoccus vermicola]
MTDEKIQHLLIVDDDERFRERLAISFRRRGYQVSTASGNDEALALCEKESFDAAVVDLCMPNGSGLALIGALRDLDPAMDVLILTGYGSVSTAKEALRQGAVDYLMKPTDAEEIEKILTSPPESPKVSTPTPDLSVPSLERVEWEHIQRVLVDCENNVSEAARRLGIERRTLQRKLRKYPPVR